MHVMHTHRRVARRCMWPHNREMSIWWVNDLAVWVLWESTCERVRMATHACAFIAKMLFLPFAIEEISHRTFHSIHVTHVTHSPQLKATILLKHNADPNTNKHWALQVSISPVLEPLVNCRCWCLCPRPRCVVLFPLLFRPSCDSVDFCKLVLPLFPLLFYE